MKKPNRLAVLLAVLALAFGVLLSAPRQALADSFTDVTDKTPHYEDIKWMNEYGISTGFDDNTFRPYANIARCDMAAFLYRLAGKPLYTPTAADKVRFSDVDASTPHAKEIWWLASVGISTGFDDGTFRPYDTVKRCDMAAFLYRLANSPTYTPNAIAKASFSDVDASTPHAKEVWWLAAKGISTGFEDGTYRPYEPVARCDMAAFLHRLQSKGLISMDNFDKIADAQNQCYAILTGTLRILSAEELCELCGVPLEIFSPLSGTNSFYAVLVFDAPKQVNARQQDSPDLYGDEAQMILLAKKEKIGGSTYTLGTMSTWEPYDGKSVTVGIDEYDTWWPSDVSLPPNQPRTGSAVFIVES